MLSFHVKFLQTDRQMDRRTMVKQYTPDLSIRGHKKGELLDTSLPAFSPLPTIFFLKAFFLEVFKTLNWRG